MNPIKNILIIIEVILIMYLAILGVIWKYNNPGGSGYAFWFHFNDAVHCRALPQYQLP